MSGLSGTIPTKIERVVIEKLDNGYSVSADTKLAGIVGHYCSNLKGVTKALWFMFEGKTKATKDQAAFMRGLADKGKDTEKDETKENEDA